jgi:hypothetical protein
MKNFLYVFFIIFLISCKENGDDLVGNYLCTNNNNFAKIKKAGDDGYFLSFGDKYDDNLLTSYCVYRNGCFTHEYEDKKTPIMCTSGDYLVDYKNLTYKKVSKLEH